MNRLRSPFRTAKSFWIDEVIDPRDTRRLLCDFANLAAPLREPGRPGSACVPDHVSPGIAKSHSDGFAPRGERSGLVQVTRKSIAGMAGWRYDLLTTDAGGLRSPRAHDWAVNRSPIGMEDPRLQPTNIQDPDYFHKVVDCQWACPAHTPVPEYIRLIAAGRYADAFMINWNSNVFPGILGRTCDRPCEPACRRGRVEEEPVAICRLKRVAADYKGDIRDRLPPGRQRNGKKIAWSAPARPR